MAMSVGLGRRRVWNVGLAVEIVLASLLACISVLIGDTVLSVAQAQTQTRIDIEGNHRIEADTIRSYFHVNGTERLDAGGIDAALKALYATGLFQNVRITPGNGRILVSVVENPVIDKVPSRVTTR